MPFVMVNKELELLRDITFVRFIGHTEGPVITNGLPQMFALLMFVSTSKNPSSKKTYKIPCKNDLERSSMTADTNTCHRIKKFC